MKERPEQSSLELEAMTRPKRAYLATTLNVQAKKLRLFLTALLRPARGFPFAMPLVWPLPFMIEPADSAMVDRSEARAAVRTVDDGSFRRGEEASQKMMQSNKSDCAKWRKSERLLKKSDSRRERRIQPFLPVSFTIHEAKLVFFGQ